VELLTAYDAYFEDREADRPDTLNQGLALLGQAEEDNLPHAILDPLRLELAEHALEAERPALALELLAPILEAHEPSAPEAAHALGIAIRAQEALGEPEAAQELLFERLDALISRLGSRSTALTSTLSLLVANEEAAGRTDVASRLREHLSQLDDQPEVTPKGLVEADTVFIPVHYGTNRMASGDDDPAAFYGSERAQGFELGIAQVSIPREHRVGALESPKWWAFEFRADPEKHVILRKVEPLDREIFIERIRSQLGGQDQMDGLLFIPGYSVSFEHAARRAAQLAYDIEFDGPTFLFSWPSRDSLFGYWADAAELITRQTGVRRLHVIAHSMGNRYLLEVLETFAEADADVRPFGSIVLAAPDVDSDDFRERVPKAASLAEQVTLYTSPDDLMLKLSEAVNGTPRAGAVAVVNAGLDTIDASLVDTGILGHSYIGDSDLVLADLVGLVNLGWQPPVRCSLVPVSISGGEQLPYWQLHADGCQLEQLRTIDRLARRFGLNGVLEQARAAFAAAFARDETSVSFWRGVIAIVEMAVAEGQLTAKTAK
jgi:esterase/lipase superfamily enzyme